MRAGSDNTIGFAFEKIPLLKGDTGGKESLRKDPQRILWSFWWEIMTFWTRILVKELERNRHVEYIFYNEMFEPAETRRELFIDMFQFTTQARSNNINSINNNNKRKTNSYQPSVH